MGVAQRLIARVAPQRAAKPVEIVICDRSTVHCGCIRSICHDQVQILNSFGLNLLGAQCAYERGSVVILIVRVLLAHPEIDSTHRKKYGG